MYLRDTLLWLAAQTSVTRAMQISRKVNVHISLHLELSVQFFERQDAAQYKLMELSFI